MLSVSPTEKFFKKLKINISLLLQRTKVYGKILAQMKRRADADRDGFGEPQGSSVIPPGSSTTMFAWVSDMRKENTQVRHP